MNEEQLERVKTNIAEARHDALVIRDALQDCVNYLNDLAKQIQELRDVVYGERVVDEPTPAVE